MGKILVSLREETNNLGETYRTLASKGLPNKKTSQILLWGADLVVPKSEKGGDTHPTK